MLAVRSSTMHIARPRKAAVARGSPEQFFAALDLFAGHSCNTHAVRPCSILEIFWSPAVRPGMCEYRNGAKIPSAFGSQWYFCASVSFCRLCCFCYRLCYSCLRFCFCAFSSALASAASADASGFVHALKKMHQISANGLSRRSCVQVGCR